jgi:hypothetical protein
MAALAGKKTLVERARHAADPDILVPGGRA